MGGVIILNTKPLPMISWLENILTQNKWVKRSEYITFKMGGFSNAASRPEFSARLYKEVNLLTEVLRDIEAETCLEAGCGYGRLSPWIADLSKEYEAIEPNKDALEGAKEQYPELNFSQSKVQDLPFNDDRFDLVVSWTVLQHISPKNIKEAALEIERVLRDGGYLVLCEETLGGEDIEQAWHRPPEDYEGLFDNLEMTKILDREVENTYDAEDAGKLMVLKNEG